MHVSFSAALLKPARSLYIGGVSEENMTIESKSKLTIQVIPYICRLGSFHKIYCLWRPFLSDPKDDHILELAVASGVRKIVTFNARDFRGSERFNVEIVSPKRLLEEIKWER